MTDVFVGEKRALFFIFKKSSWQKKRSNCDCAQRLGRAVMTSQREEVRICHVGLCAAHLTLLLLKIVGNFKSPYMSFAKDQTTPEHHQRPIVRRHVGAVRDFENWKAVQ